MDAPTTPQTAPASGLRAPVFACAAVLVAAVAASYARSLGGPFLYDDIGAIAGNATIRRLATVLEPPFGTTVSGRPVLNASFALNYALSGSAVWSYHVLNIAIHAVAALLLFGIIRR